MSDRRLRWSLHVVVLAILVATWFFGGRARAQEDEPYVYTAADTYAAIDIASVEHGVSWRWLYAIVRCETGGTFNPYSVGRARELGAVQLHPRGELPRFYRWGYDNPFSPYQAVAFLAQRLNQGAARAWSCA